MFKDVVSIKNGLVLIADAKQVMLSKIMYANHALVDYPQIHQGQLVYAMIARRFLIQLLSLALIYPLTLVLMKISLITSVFQGIKNQVRIVSILVKKVLILTLQGNVFAQADFILILLLKLARSLILAHQVQLGINQHFNVSVPHQINTC